MAVTLLAICPTCQEIRYRSRPLVKGDLPTANDFTPVGEGVPPAAGDIPMCHVCQAVLKVGPEAPIDRTPNPGTRPIIRPASTVPTPETVFEVRDGESIADIRQFNDGIVVFTNRRIVRLPLL